MAAALALLLAAPLVGADHLQGYENNPVDHDDLGRSNEPDGERTPVGMFPFQVVQAVIDRDLDRFADVPTPPAFVGKSSVIAPGCTDINGNRGVSGQCGISSILGNLPGISINEGNCPGRYGGSTTILFDSRADFAIWGGGGHSVPFDLNYKLQDLDAQTGGVLRSLGVRPVLSGTMMMWAWYGIWTDKNCNGVIDHLANDNSVTASSTNEFVWLGACLDHTDNGPIVFRPQTISGGLCAEDPNPNSAPRGQVGGQARTNMTAWVWPGDFPASATPPGLPVGGLSSSQLLPLFNEDFNNLRPDLFGWDNSGAITTEDRYWLLGNEPPAWFYDQSTFVDTWVVTGVNCLPAPGTQQFMSVGVSGGPGSPCTFLDVDRYSSFSPLTRELLPPVKSTVYSLYNFAAGIVNGIYGDQGPVNRFVEQLLGKDFYDSTLGPQTGLLQDLLVDQGWSREPNVGPTVLEGAGITVEDLHVDLRHAPCDRDENVSDLEEAHRGWCNYAPSDPTGDKAYAAFQGSRERGWMDLKAQKVAFWVPPTDLSTFGFGALGSIGQAWPFDAWDPLFPGSSPLSPDDHRRTLDPGQWRFSGAMGRWRDAVNHVDESVFPHSSAELPCRDAPSQPVCVTYPKDGWVGFVSDGWQEYQGFESMECITERGRGVYPWAVCNPYKDGNQDEPQDYDDDNGEWTTACNVPADAVVWVYPRDGEWSVPVLVAPDPQGTPHNWLEGPPYESYLPGDTRAIPLRMHQCSGANDIVSKDHLVLPFGSMGEDIVTVFTASVPVTLGGLLVFDEITDVDVYASAVIE